MDPHARARIAAELAAFDSLLEVGVGRRCEVAAALASRGCRVTAIDVVERSVPEGVRFVRADVVALAASEDPVETLEDADPPAAVYGLNLPAELQRPTVDLADRLDAACVFTTLGFEEPVVPVDRRAVGEATLYVARGRPSDGPRGRPGGPGRRSDE